MLPLSEVMRCGIFTNSRGDALLVHDQYISGLAWVEYDHTDRSLTLVYDDGRMQSFGYEISNRSGVNIRTAVNVHFALLKGGAIKNVIKLALVQR